MAPQEHPLPEARTTKGHFMATHTISPAGDPFTSKAVDQHQDHPHACLNGYVYLGYTVVDEETGEETERVEVLPCRRCIEA
jgi:hypothetical protein